MAQSRHADRVGECPLSGVKRTSQIDRIAAANDPTRTSATKFGATHAAQLTFTDMLEWRPRPEGGP